MFEQAPRYWFYHGESTRQKEKEKRSRQLLAIPSSYKAKILRDFNLSLVLPHLVYDGVLSLNECKEIFSQDCYPQRVESFLLKLFSKGPKAFCAFCSHLEEFCPYLLTCFFLYYQEQTPRILQAASAAEEKARIGIQLEGRDAADTEDQEQSLQLLNEYVDILNMFAALKKSCSPLLW